MRRLCGSFDLRQPLREQLLLGRRHELAVEQIDECRHADVRGAGCRCAEDPVGRRGQCRSLRRRQYDFAAGWARPTSPSHSGDTATPASSAARRMASRRLMIDEPWFVRSHC